MRICCGLTGHLELARRPDLYGKPVIVGRWDEHVVAASEETLPFGVIPGMALRQAEHLCPQATFVLPDEEATARIRELISAALYDLAPLVEVRDEGIAWLDISGVPAAGHSIRSARHRLLKAIGREPRLGLAPGPFSARLAAARARPGRLLRVADAREFLAPLPSRELPLDAEQLARVDRPPSIEEHTGAVRSHRVVDQGMAAARPDHRAVDRAAGPGGSGQASAEVVGRRRRIERRGHRGSGAITGTLRRGFRSEAAVCRIAGMIGNFQKNTCTGVEVDPTLAAQPRAVGIGDPTTNLLSEHAFVDLRGGIRSRHQEQPRIWIGRPGTRFCHQRQTPTVETYNPETLSWLVQPLGLSTRSKVHTIDLVGQRPDRSPGDNWVGVGGIHGLGPDDAFPGPEHRIEIFEPVPHGSSTGFTEPQPA